jgi:protein tyrosine phosphatase
LEYHTNHRLLQYYGLKKYPVHVYEVDDRCVPSDVKSFANFVDLVIKVICYDFCHHFIIFKLVEEGKRVCVHCHSGTGRTGLFIACCVKKV